MSFWAGVVQGVKDVDVLKEKEALAEERKAADAEAKAYRDKMFEYNSRRDAAADSRAERTEERLLEDRAWTRAQTAAVEVDAANAVLGGTRPSAASGSGGGGSAPAANDIKDSNIQFNGWVETQLKDEALSSEDADYITGVVDSFTDPKDAHEFWTLYTDIRESTGQAPSVEQLRNTIRVTQVPGYADNRKQAEEMLAVINGIDATTPEGLLKVRTLRKQLERVDLNAATIDADTSSYVTSEERPKLYEDQAKTFETELTTNWLSEEEQNALESAPTPAAATILMSRYRTKYGAQALSTLKSEYPREFREAQGNPAFRGIVSADAATTTLTEEGGADGAPDGVPDGVPGGVPGGAPDGAPDGGTVDTAAIFADLSKDPNNAELQQMVAETVGPEVFNSMMQKIQKPYKEYGETRQTERDQAPLTAADVREQAEGVVKTLGEGIETVQNFTQTAGGVADVGAAYALTPFSKFQNATNLTLASILDAAGLTENADRLYQAVADSVNGRQETRDSGLISSMLKSDSVDVDILDFMANTFGFNKEELADKPEAMQAISELESDVRQRIGTVGFQDTGLRPAESGPQGAPEGPSDTNLERMEQSRLDQVGMEPDTLDIEQTRIPPEDLRTTVSTGDERPVVEGIGDLSEPSVLDSVTSAYTASKGAPLDPEEELAVGIEAIVGALTGGGMDQGELDNLIIELNTKYGEDKVREALDLAMNQ